MALSIPSTAEAGQLITRRIAAGAFFAFVNLGLTVAMLGPALPYLARNTGSTLGAISYLFMVQNVGYLLGSFFSGRLYDRLRTGRLMGGAFLAMLPVLAAVPLARSLSVLLPLIGLLGLLQGTVDVGGNFLIICTPLAGRSVRMNALHTSFGWGALVTPLAIRQALRWGGGIDWGFWLLALFALAAAVWLLRLPSARGSAQAAGPAASPARPLVVGLVIAYLFLVVGIEGAFGGWIFTYASRRRLASEAQAFLINSLYWGSLAVGRLFGTLLARRLGPRAQILASLGGCLAASAALLAWPASAPAAWAATAAFGFFIGPTIANMLTLAGEAMTLSGRVTSLFVVGFSLGGIVLPWLVGQGFEPLGPWVLPAALLAAVVLAFACLQGFLAVARASRSR